MKIKDTITLRAIAGLIGTTPQLVFHYIFWQTGYVKYFSFQLTGSYNLGGAKIVPYDINTNLIVLLSSLIYGILTPYLIVKWGD